MPAPERLLYVRPVLGNTYAAVAASTAMSSWVQLDDRTAGASFPSTLTTPARMGHREEVGVSSPDEPYVFDFPHYITWQNFTTGVANSTGAADPYGGTFTPGGVRASHSGGEVSGTLPGDDDPIYYIDSHIAAWAPSLSAYAVNPTQARWQDTWRPSWPVGAIGYEVEQHQLDDGTWRAQAQPVSATVSFTLHDASTTGLEWMGGQTLIALNSRFGDATMTEGGVVLGARPDFDRTNATDTALGSATSPVGAPAFNPDVAVTLTVTDFSDAPDRSGLFALWQSVAAPGGFSGGIPSWPNTGIITVLSSRTGQTITYTIRPPRIRWIFPSDPYRRTYPRDDALAGGTTRTWPPARSVQSSNRTFGGYL